MAAQSSYFRVFSSNYLGLPSANYSLLLKTFKSVSTVSPIPSFPGTLSTSYHQSSSVTHNRILRINHPLLVLDFLQYHWSCMRPRVIVQAIIQLSKYKENLYAKHPIPSSRRPPVSLPPSATSNPESIDFRLYLIFRTLVQKFTVDQSALASVPLQELVGLLSALSSLSLRVRTDVTSLCYSFPEGQSMTDGQMRLCATIHLYHCVLEMFNSQLASELQGSLMCSLLTSIVSIVKLNHITSRFIVVTSSSWKLKGSKCLNILAAEVAFRLANNCVQILPQLNADMMNSISFVLDTLGVDHPVLRSAMEDRRSVEM